MIETTVPANEKLEAEKKSSPSGPSTRFSGILGSGTGGEKYVYGGSEAAQYRTGGETGVRTHTHAERTPAIRGALAHGACDAGILSEARVALESVDPDDPVETQLALDALAGTVAAMWDSVADSSEIYQDVLAILESAAKQAAIAGELTLGQADLFREAMHDLGQSHLVPGNANVLRRRFLDEGFAPLAFLGDEHVADDEE